MTRPLSDVQRVFELTAEGLSKKAVSRRTGIARSTIRQWLARGSAEIVNHAHRRAPCDMSCRQGISEIVYSYLLGVYLGDGSISKHGRGGFRLRLFSDSRYPAIIKAWETGLSVISGKPALIQKLAYNCVVVGVYSRHWPHFFPQHGPGMKHTRKIMLEPWQEAIVDECPREFIRGLIESDGCRVVNKVKNGRYAYPRYFFANESTDILELFGRACDRMGVDWRYNRPNSISIARRRSVELLDSFIGPKR